MKCKILSDAKLKILHVDYMKDKVQFQYVDYDNEEEVMR